MRVSLFAGLAALGAAVDFDDDDMNFLRMLSSNASGGNMTATTAPATQPINTTAPMANTTMAPSTTPAATTGAGNGTETTAAETTAATTPAQETTQGMTETPQTTPTPVTGDLCVVANYAALGLAAPSGMALATGDAAKWGIECDGASKQTPIPEAKTYYEKGAKAQLETNTAKCVADGGTVTALTCGEAAFLTEYNKNSMKGKMFMLAFCCGTPSAGMPSASLSSPKSGGNLKLGRYSDSACATPLTADAAATQLDFARSNGLYGGGAAEKTAALGTCHDLGYFGIMKFTACNGTATAETNALKTNQPMSIMEGYIDSACAKQYSVNVFEQTFCKSVGESSSRRELAAHTNSSSSGTYMQTMCEGGSTPATLAVVTSVATTMSNVPADLAPAAKTEIVDATANAVKAQADLVDTTVTNTVKEKSGTGNLAASRRRLSARRLAGHTVTSVITVLEALVPAAAADTFKGAMDTAVSDPAGKLNPTQLDAAIVTAVKATTAGASLNITAVSTTTVAEPSIPVSSTSTGSGGSTSGAVTEYLSYAAGFVFAAALIM
jgi:hypothetical protein